MKKSDLEQVSQEVVKQKQKRADCYRSGGVNMCEINKDESQRFIEQFVKSHIEPRPKVVIVGAPY